MSDKQLRYNKLYLSIYITSVAGNHYRITSFTTSFITLILNIISVFYIISDHSVVSLCGSIKINQTLFVCCFLYLQMESAGMTFHAPIKDRLSVPLESDDFWSDTETPGHLSLSHQSHRRAEVPVSHFISSLL